MKDIEDLLGDIPCFLTRLFVALDKDGIDVSNSELDHICYRVETNERYEQLKEGLAGFGGLLSETMIGGRLISTYKLKVPIVFEERKIFCVELPSPKAGSHYPERLEHAEFVIADGFEDFMKRYPAVEFDTAASSKPINPDIRVQYTDFSVKFHHKPLEYVIEHEQ